MDWQNHTIYTRDDGSFIIQKDGLPYHVPNSDEFAELYQEVSAYAAEHPEQVEPEVVQVPEITLEGAKAEALAALREYRLGIEYGGVMIDRQRWDTEPKDELRLNSAFRIFASGVEEYPGWKISDGVYITLTLEILERAVQAYMQHYGNAFAVEAAKIEEIKALETIEEVQTWLDTQLAVGWD